MQRNSLVTHILKISLCTYIFFISYTTWSMVNEDESSLNHELGEFLEMYALSQEQTLSTSPDRQASIETSNNNNEHWVHTVLSEQESDSTYVAQGTAPKNNIPKQKRIALIPADHIPYSDVPLYIDEYGASLSPLFENHLSSTITPVIAAFDAFILQGSIPILCLILHHTGQNLTESFEQTLQKYAPYDANEYTLLKICARIFNLSLLTNALQIFEKNYSTSIYNNYNLAKSMHVIQYHELLKKLSPEQFNTILDYSPLLKLLKNIHTNNDIPLITVNIPQKCFIPQFINIIYNVMNYIKNNSKNENVYKAINNPEIEELVHHELKTCNKSELDTLDHVSEKLAMFWLQRIIRDWSFKKIHAEYTQNLIDTHLNNLIILEELNKLSANTSEKVTPIESIEKTNNTEEPCKAEIQLSTELPQQGS